MDTYDPLQWPSRGGEGVSAQGGVSWGGSVCLGEGGLPRRCLPRVEVSA